MNSHLLKYVLAYCSNGSNQYGTDGQAYIYCAEWLGTQCLQHIIGIEYLRYRTVVNGNCGTEWTVTAVQGTNGQ